MQLFRQVSEEEGKELASQLKCAWVETSARHDVNIGEWQWQLSFKNGQSNAPFFLGVTEKVFDLILGETERDTVEGGPEPPASKCIIA